MGEAESRARVLFVGRATLDVLYRLDAFPEEDTKTFAREVRVAPGGPATNAAITHALLGGEAVLMTALGRGLWATQVLDELTRLGIEVIDLAADTKYEMPLTTVLVSEADATRTIVNPPATTVPLQRLEAWEESRGARPELILTDGFHLSETLPLLAECRRAGARIVLDGGSWKPGTEELAPLLTAAICSERFRVPEQDPGSSESTLDWFENQGVKLAAVTRGARPIAGTEAGRRFAIQIEAVGALDTLGAGDVLHGAFCHRFAQSAGFEEALRFAARIATRSCKGLGVRAWVEESVR